MWDQFVCNLSNPSVHVQMDTKSTEQVNSEGIQTAGLDEVFPPVVHVFLVFFGENCMTQAVFFKMYQAEFQEISTILRKYMSPMDFPMDSPMDSPKKVPDFWCDTDTTGTSTSIERRQTAWPSPSCRKAKTQTWRRGPNSVDGYGMGPPFDS